MRAGQGHARASSSPAFLQKDAGVSRKRGHQWGWEMGLYPTYLLFDLLLLSPQTPAARKGDGDNSH